MRPSTKQSSGLHVAPLAHVYGQREGVSSGEGRAAAQVGERSPPLATRGRKRRRRTRAIAPYAIHARSVNVGARSKVLLAFVLTSVALSAPRDAWAQSPDWQRANDAHAQWTEAVERLRTMDRAHDARWAQAVVERCQDHADRFFGSDAEAMRASGWYATVQWTCAARVGRRHLRRARRPPR
jgi:hypothetical protein